MTKQLDVLIFGGQSNMEGQTEGPPESSLAVENAFEYRFTEDELIPLAHPVGESVENLLFGPYMNCGTLVPDCCRTYVNITNRTVVAIHAACGNTRIDEWEKGSPRYACALKKIKAGIEKAKTLGKVRKIYYVWLQGESDAINRTSEEEYVRRLTDYKNDLKNDIGIDKFGIIEVGYFCATVRWLTDRSKDDGKACDEAIMRAQEKLPSVDDDFIMLTQICKSLSLDERYINPFEDGHYNNSAMELIGKETGVALAKL